MLDTKEDVNEWYKENTGHPFYTEVYENGTEFTEATVSDLANVLNNSNTLFQLTIKERDAFFCRSLMSFWKYSMKLHCDFNCCSASSASWSV